MSLFISVALFIFLQSKIRLMMTNYLCFPLCHFTSMSWSWRRTPTHAQKNTGTYQKAGSYINATQSVHALMCEHEHTVPHVQKSLIMLTRTRICGTSPTHMTL